MAKKGKFEEKTWKYLFYIFLYEGYNIEMTHFIIYCVVWDFYLLN